MDRFWSKVDKSGDCWLWTASKMTSGYGQFWTGKTLTGAHRFSYELTFGEIPDSLLVMHSCDNKLCVNPSHLTVGSQSDNKIDMAIKGRDNRKLSISDVREIRDLRRNGFKVKVIAAMYSVGRHYAGHIINYNRRQYV